MSVFNLPDIGEGLQEAEIVEWTVNVGDSVQVDDIILVIETDKAAVEIPSPTSGKIVKLFCQAGDIVPVGAPLIEFEVAETRSDNALETAREDSGTVVGKIETSEEILTESATGFQAGKLEISRVKASPAVRALATQLGVDLSLVKPTGPKNAITRDDVNNALQSKPAGSGERPKPAESGPIGEPLKRARRSMALNMAKSHAEVAQVTLMEDADISHWVNQDMTVRLTQAIVAACLAEPTLNAYYDHALLSLKTFSEVHLGIAVDSKAGLFVPVIRNAEQIEPTKAREIINSFKTKARDKSFQAEELRGGTIILSNFGGIGGWYATPMVVPPMVAIVGVGKTRQELVLVDGSVVPAKKLPLSISFDHRAATGGEAARFLTTMIQLLEA